MADVMRIRVLLFAMLAELAALRELELSLPADATVRQAVDRLWQMYPLLQKFPRQHLLCAVNQTYAAETTLLADGDELALIPPVSGGAGEQRVRDGSADGRFLLTTDPLDPETARRHVWGPHIGGTSLFVGTVRGVTGQQRTTHLVYEAYPAMVIAEMERIAADMQRQWPDVQVALHHRVGKLHVGDIAVVVAAAAPHRENAFAACRYGIDAVKTRCPIWKKEFYADGAAQWVVPTTPSEAKEAHP